MTNWFPMSQWYADSDSGHSNLRWEVIVEPVPPPTETVLVLSDLDRDGVVDIEKGGRLRHRLQCRAQHLPRHQFQDLVLEDRAFLIELAYREPPGHPQVRCIEPRLTASTLPGHPHFYGSEIVCPLFPPDGTWKWTQHTAADYLMHVAVWLLKTTVWEITSDIRGEGTWLGPDVGHSLDRLLRIQSGAQCACGSGNVYRKCCMRKHRAMHARQIYRR